MSKFLAFLTALLNAALLKIQKDKVDEARKNPAEYLAGDDGELHESELSFDDISKQSKRNKAK